MKPYLKFFLLHVCTFVPIVFQYLKIKTWNSLKFMFGKSTDLTVLSDAYKVT